jgi:uncharacterized membrane protein YeaQ/YmgE (transglycosylase-associated protein family)
MPPFALRSGLPVLEGALSIIAWLVVGLIAGWLAEKITGRDHGLFTNLVVGIIGALIGGFLFSSILGFQYHPGFNLASVVVATAGAVLFLFALGWMRGNDRLSS